MTRGWTPVCHDNILPKSGITGKEKLYGVHTTLYLEEIEEKDHSCRISIAIKCVQTVHR